MPVRNRERKVFGGPQGEDAWVIVKGATVGESSEQQRRILEIGVSSAEAEKEAIAYISSHIIDWNWVDDDGKTLTKPSDNPEILTTLLREELEFVASVIRGTNPAVQNFLKK